MVMHALVDAPILGMMRQQMNKNSLIRPLRKACNWLRLGLTSPGGRLRGKQEHRDKTASLMPTNCGKGAFNFTAADWDPILKDSPSSLEV